MCARTGAAGAPGAGLFGEKKKEEEEDEKNILQYGLGPLICLWRIGLCRAKFHFVDNSALFNSGAKKEKKRKEEESCPQVDLSQ